LQGKLAGAKAVTTAKGVRWSWKYETAVASSRDLRLDFLRGLSIFVMLMDHIGVFGPDSWVYFLTARGEFYISAAEGFVIISGFILGIVYFKVIEKEGLRFASTKILKRALKIYWLAVGLTLFFVLLSNYSPLQLWADRQWSQITDPIDLLLGTLTMRFAYHGSSILFMYVLFLAISPLILFLLQEGKAKHVLIISWVIWFANMYYPSNFTLPFASNFPLASWQALFVTAMVMGYHRHAITNFFSAKGNLYRYYSLAIGAMSVMLVSLYIAEINGGVETIFGSIDVHFYIADMHDKSLLPPERIFAIFVIFQGLFLASTWLWKLLQPVLGWLLIPIGEVSLYSFAMHLVIIVIFYNIPGVRDLPYFFYGFALLASVLLLWGMVKTKFLFSIIPH
jgi:hypothetical protein